MEHVLWVEKYRPKKVEDCILPDAIKSTFQEYVNRKEIPNLLLSGSAGVGKTTIAKALCEEVGCDNIVINGSDESGIDVLRNKIKNYASSISLMGGRKVVIIDEAHERKIQIDFLLLLQDGISKIIADTKMHVEKSLTGFFI